MLKQKVYQKFVKAFLVDDLSVSYTLKTDDITVADKPQGTPYVSRKGAFDERGYNAETQTSLNITEENGGVAVVNEYEVPEMLGWTGGVFEYFYKRTVLTDKEDI